MYRSWSDSSWGISASALYNASVSRTSSTGFSFSKLDVMYAHSPGLSNTPRSTGLVAVMPRSWATSASISAYRLAFGSFVSGAGDSVVAWAGSQSAEASAEPEGDSPGAAESDGAGDAAVDGEALVEAGGVGVGVWEPHAATSSAMTSAARPPDRRSGVVIGVECAMPARRGHRQPWFVPARCAFLNRSGARG